nr:MAG TPA_asm: hypothetical protein [Caudoviricetes sp.]
MLHCLYGSVSEIFYFSFRNLKPGCKIFTSSKCSRAV